MRTSSTSFADQMVERYLLHTRTNPADRARLYGLAMLRRPDEPRALGAALDVPETSYDAELSRLHRRYGFIFTKQEQPALHQEVRHFLRLWLLQHRHSSPEIMHVIRRLNEAYLTSFQELEIQRRYASLRERLEDEQWRGLYLDLTEQRFWLDPVEGLNYALPFMLAASVYHREANRETRAIGEFFQEVLVQPYRKHWDWANQSLVYSTSRNPLPEELSGLKDIVRLASQNKIAFSPPPPPFQEELEGALWWRLGEAYQGKSPHQSVNWYEKALSRLPGEEGLREALTEASWDRDHISTEEEAAEENTSEQATSISSEEIATANSSNTAATTTAGTQETLIDLDRALERNPKSVRAYAQRGESYLLLKEYRRAVADFDRALELAPQDASLYAKRGEAYLLLREHRRAIADFDRALAIEPGNEGVRTRQHEVASELAKSQQTPITVPRERALPLRLSHRLPVWMTVLMVVLAILFVSGSSFVYYNVAFLQPLQQHAQATATAQSIAVAGIVATALARSNLIASATVTANSYDGDLQILALNDPLNQNSGAGWDETSGSCTFEGDGYHAINLIQASSKQVCLAQNTNFGDAIFQVVLSIGTGSGGGILLHSTASTSYYFRIGQDGTYALLLCAGPELLAIRR